MFEDPNDAFSFLKIIITSTKDSSLWNRENNVMEKKNTDFTGITEFVFSLPS